jgi:glycerol kinase
MANEWILAIDQGTTNTKALLVDRNGQTVFGNSAPVKLIQPQSGWVEQDPIELWESVIAVARECKAFADSASARIAGIAITNQRETAVAWRRSTANPTTSGSPAGNAITWQCRRSSSICDEVRNEASTIRSITGLPLDPLLSATKWAWLLDTLPELRAQAEDGALLLGTVDSWILFNLTGGRVHATDHSNASRTALMSLESLGWDRTLSALFEIPEGSLPEIRSSGGDFGVCTGISELAGIPIVSMIGDSHGALAGHGCYQAGAVKATYGTGSSLMMLTEGLVHDDDRLARTVAWSMGNDVRFALEGNIAMSGAALQWVGEFLGFERPAERGAALAATVADSGGMFLVPAMVGLGAPYWDTAARGIICNVERSHSSAHLARAALDSIAYQVADVLECMEAAAGVRLPMLLADGGATRNDSLMQMQADVIGRTVLRSMQEELSARGAALLGGISLCWWKSLDELECLPTSVERFEPLMIEGERQSRRRAWKLAVSRARLREEVSEKSQVLQGTTKW